MSNQPPEHMSCASSLDGVTYNPNSAVVLQITNSSQRWFPQLWVIPYLCWTLNSSNVPAICGRFNYGNHAPWFSQEGNTLHITAAHSVSEQQVFVHCTSFFNTTFASSRSGVPCLLVWLSNLYWSHNSPCHQQTAAGIFGDLWKAKWKSSSLSFDGSVWHRITPITSGSIFS